MGRNYDDTATSVHQQGSQIITQHSQDVSGVLRDVQDIKQQTGGKSHLGYHAGKIPMTLMMKWGLEDAGDKLAYLQGKHNKDPDLAKKLAARLNSPEFRAFRIWEGNIAATDFLKEGNKVNTD